MKKIALVIYYHRQNFYSLNAIAGALETDKIFESIEFYFSSSKDKLLEIIKELVETYDKIVVAFSFFTSQLFETHDLVQKIKNKYEKRCLLLAGGSHPTGDPFGTLKMGFDVVVVGEGEDTIVNLMQKIVSSEELSE
ncbi:MAG: cobalamin-dependent protein, partial [Promethearchaeota archaeon]